MNNADCAFMIVLTTTDDESVAHNIIVTLIEAKLAACIQMDPVTSFYSYQNKMHQDKEYRLMIKAASCHYDAIEAMIKSLHNYDLPQVIKLGISGGEESYLNWVRNAQ